MLIAKLVTAKVTARYNLGSVPQPPPTVSIYLSGPLVF